MQILTPNPYPKFIAVLRWILILERGMEMEIDGNMLKRIQAVSKLPEKEKETVFVFLDSFIDRMKLQGVL